MRIDRVYIDGFKNLKNLIVDFDESRLATVVIGQNGSGKSNLIEAIVDIFRFADLNRGVPRFKYEIDYRVGDANVRLTNRNGSVDVLVNGKKISRASFEREREMFFPDLVFGYYSGSSRRLERLFDSHQRRYYDEIKLNDDLAACEHAMRMRRLFYCRPIHGVFALMSFFAFPDHAVGALLRDKLGITGFHSALALFRRPWFAKPSRGADTEGAKELWDAKGPAGRCARRLRDIAFHPIALRDRPIDDYRDKGTTEEQFAAFLRDLPSLKEFASAYDDDRAVFYALEAVDISDLLRDLHVWLIRANDTSGDVAFDDLSDGERQLLMVLGLIRVSRGRRALFLLDEPDTHLNPAWQHSYLDLIASWTGIAANASDCQIVMTSHNPLTIAGLEREDVRVLHTDGSSVFASIPYADPKGMGFTATLTEIFGMQTSLDPDTPRMLDERNRLAAMADPTEADEQRLIFLNDRLGRLGFMFQDREPLYQDFLRAFGDVKYADRPPLSPQDVQRRHEAMKAMINSLLVQEKSPS
jgi:predicted ATPase